MAKGHLFLVLAVLLGAGPVLGINVDLREQELETQELKLAASSEFVNVVDQAELMSVKELDQFGSDGSRAESRMKNKKCKHIGGYCKGKVAPCKFQRAPTTYDCLSPRRKCCLPPSSCMFGGKTWPHGSYLPGVCFELLCNDGTWEYKGNNGNACGECKVEGDPHVVPFDPLPDNPNNGFPIPTSSYLLNRKKPGVYIFTQHELAVPALFGVEANVEECDYLSPHPRSDGSCITNVTYHEPGFNVTLTLPPAGDIATFCVNGTSDPANYTECDIKVSVNGISIGPVGDSIQEVSGGYGGPILVFKHKHITNFNDLNCMNIVGTKGLSVSLCEVYQNFPFMYIWALPSLKPTLEGMCNTWTGSITTDFKKQDGTVVPWNVDPGKKCLDYSVSLGPGICDDFSQSWKLPIPP